AGHHGVSYVQPRPQISASQNGSVLDNRAVSHFATAFETAAARNQSVGLHLHISPDVSRCHQAGTAMYLGPLIDPYPRLLLNTIRPDLATTQKRIGDQLAKIASVSQAIHVSACPEGRHVCSHGDLGHDGINEIRWPVKRRIQKPIIDRTLAVVYRSDLLSLLAMELQQLGQLELHICTQSYE